MSNRSTTSTTPGQQQGQQIPQDKIAMRAYQKWCLRGCPQGTDQQDWYEAETELRAEMMRQQPGPQGRR